MANQRILFTGPPGSGTNITIDVIDLDTDAVEQAGVTSEESTNAKGVYLSAIFVDTLAGRFFLRKKLSGTDFGSDFVSLANASATYKADALLSTKQHMSGTWTVGDNEAEVEITD